MWDHSHVTNPLVHLIVIPRLCNAFTYMFSHQGCISCGTCSYLELTEDHVLTSAYVKIFRIVTRNAVNKSFWRKKDCSWPPLKQICNEYLIKFSENQSAPKLENRKTSPCSPCAPNLLHVLMSRTTGYHNLCSPGCLQQIENLPADKAGLSCLGRLYSYGLEKGFLRYWGNHESKKTSYKACYNIQKVRCRDWAPYFICSGFMTALNMDYSQRANA